jgi:hypothetical protein
MVMKYNVAIFGAGNIGNDIYEMVKDHVDVVAFFDNAAKKRTTTFNGLPVYPPPENCNEYDYIYIASITHCKEMREQLLSKCNVPARKIVDLFSTTLASACVSDMITGPRNLFLLKYVKYCRRNGVLGECAEVGVFRGDYAQLINLLFPGSCLYLFDTFNGFNETDLIVEKNKNRNYDNMMTTFGNSHYNYFRDTNVQLVMSRMAFPEQCIVKNGVFPKTFDIPDDKRFCFVNLDADLYHPTKAGLELFYPLMVHGGVILVHDYGDACEGVTIAVDDFVKSNHLAATPIGDLLSMAIIKN